MSDDEDDPIDSDPNLFDGSLDGPDSMGFGPLIPTETERSLMERVRQELKHELKQVNSGNPEIPVCYLWMPDRKSLYSFVFAAGVQGENRRYKRGNFAQEESGKASG